jgi:hypothetical protein
MLLLHASSVPRGGGLGGTGGVRGVVVGPPFLRVPQNGKGGGDLVEALGVALELPFNVGARAVCL